MVEALEVVEVVEEIQQADADEVKNNGI